MSNEFRINIAGWNYILQRKGNAILCKCEGRWDWIDIEYLGDTWLTEKLKESVEKKESRDAIKNQFIKGVMENFPEASGFLICIKWKYDEMNFKFKEYLGDGTSTIHELNMEKLLAAIPVAKERWPIGCTLFNQEMWEDEGTMDHWLCQADATDFDAFVQLAIFGDVVYG